MEESWIFVSKRLGTLYIERREAEHRAEHRAQYDLMQGAEVDTVNWQQSLMCVVNKLQSYSSFDCVCQYFVCHCYVCACVQIVYFCYLSSTFDNKWH